MININNAYVKIYDEKGIEGQICWISFDLKDQTYETMMKLGRGQHFKISCSQLKYNRDGIVYYGQVQKR